MMNLNLKHILFYCCLITLLWGTNSWSNGYTIDLYDKGAYTLKYSGIDTAGNAQTGTLYTCGWSVCSQTLNGMQPGSKLHLSAVAGRSTDVTLTHSGKVGCWGTTIIGFNCHYF